jgi:hypothetical protein
MGAKWTGARVGRVHRAHAPGPRRATSHFTSGRSVPMQLSEGSPTKGATQMSTVAGETVAGETVAGETMTAYVVRGSDGRVVVAFWGDSALAEADRWLGLDYRVDRVELPVE